MSIMTAMPQGAAVEGINPNLLDNWYFVGGGSQQGGGQFPINSRMATSYTGTSSQVYCIDRWKLQGQVGTLTIGNNGLHWETTSTTGANMLIQWVENPSAYIGKTITVSVKTSNSFDSVSMDIVAANTEYIKNINISNVTFTARVVAHTTNRYFQLVIRKDSTVFDTTIEAIKLELGDTQTLAHQENGVWVLNEIPNYGEQLLRCQTSKVDSSDNYANQVAMTNQKVCNPNLLDNWYFVGGGSQNNSGKLPINQRGQTSYNGVGYGIDRWRTQRADFAQEIQSDCLRWKAIAAVSSGNLIFCYFGPHLKPPAGTYTMSFLVKGRSGTGTWYFSSDSSTAYPIGNIPLNQGLISRTFTATGLETSSNFYLWHQGALAVGDYLDIIAVKLEVGSQQTLAHQEDGVWVPNEIPDYGEQFERCVTSRTDSTDPYANQAPNSMCGFVPLIYEGTFPASGGAVDQQMFTGYKEYYLVDMQYLNSNNSTYGVNEGMFTSGPFIQYTRGNGGAYCRLRFTIASNTTYNSRPYYVMVLAK